MNNHQYLQLRAIKSDDFHTCFYCGCIATEYDFSPPKKYAELAIQTQDDADFFQIPCCKECCDFLKGEKHALTSARMDVVKKKLALKYKRAIHIYEVWDEEEALELDYHLNKSVMAGIELGKEATKRLLYKGFSYEIEGEKNQLLKQKEVTFTVFNETFNNFKDALNYASRTFNISKAKLKILFGDHDNSFEKAIEAYRLDIDKKIYDKKLNTLCKDFSFKYKQNIDFVKRTVGYYMDKDKNISLEDALQKLFVERIQRS